MSPSKRLVFRQWRRVSRQTHLARELAAERQARSLKTRGLRVRAPG